MKSLKIALAGAALALIGAPAVAQYYWSDGDQFVEAVAKRDGNKATELLQNHPTIVDTKNGRGDTPPRTSRTSPSARRTAARLTSAKSHAARCISFV